MIINSKQSLSDAVIEIENDFEAHKWLSVSIKKGDRTARQNAWINLAYAMLEKQGDMTATEYRRYCKYTFGLKRLFSEDIEQEKLWRRMLSGLNYEEKLLAMDKISVTSLMTPDQAAGYINEIVIHFQGKQLPEKNFK